MSGIASGRGVGIQEKEIRASDMSGLFGAGGHQDGATALIRTNENIRIEEDMANTGMGERVIDESIIPNNVANLNTEFNFATAKTGAAHPQDGAVAGESFVRVTDNRPGQDVNVDTGVGKNAFDATLEALQSSFGHHYNMDASRGSGYGGANPFASAPYSVDPFSSSSTRREGITSAGDEMGAPETGTDSGMRESLDFYLSTPSTITTESRSENFNENSGLRRRNTKTSQSRQLERVAQRDDIMKAVDDSVELHANVMSEHFNSAFKSDDDRSNIYNRIHNPLNLYTVSQVGVNDVSNDSYQNTNKRHGKSSNVKMRNTLVGV